VVPADAPRLAGSETLQRAGKLHAERHEGSAVHTLNTIELKAFIPARDFNLSKQFYQDVGFVLASDSDGVAYFHHANVSFLLQDFYVKELAENLMMHLLVESVDSWWNAIREAKIDEKYGVKVTVVEQRPWRMRDFVLFDPSGVLWRIAENTD
jgi:catechol 2,3-dioxygenase-like lactoylglutathione lyase family enzyme